MPSPELPAEQSFPVQEPGTRISRALPYQFSAAEATLGVSSDGSSIEMNFQIDNTGTGGAPFMLLDNINLEDVSPRQYTVEGGKSISDALVIPISNTIVASYHLTLVGPNGFVRELKGDAKDMACKGVKASLMYAESENRVVVVVSNEASTSVEVSLIDNAYGSGSSDASLLSGESFSKEVSTKESGNWYDLTVTVSGSGAVCLYRRYMGRMETGVDTISDPAMANGIPGLLGNRAPTQHPKLGEKMRTVKRNFLATASGKDSVFYDDPKTEL